MPKFYSPALEGYRGEERFAQEKPYDYSYSPLITASAGAAALYGSGYIPIGGGKRLWDLYTGSARHFEEYFFARIPRTLQISNILSQFEQKSTGIRKLTPDLLSKYSVGQLEYLEHLTGQPRNIIKQQGLTFKNAALYLGDETTPVLSRAGIIRNINMSPRFSTAYARSMGQNIVEPNKLFEEVLPYINEHGRISKEAFQIVGGKNRAQHIKRQLFAAGTEMVERANRLAQAPFDLPGIGPIAKKILPRLHVKSGSGLQTLARMTGRISILGGGLVAGYQMADYGVRNTNFLDNTIFDEGITSAGAQLYAKSQMAYSSIAEATGLYDYGKSQEEVAPGSTSLLKLATFPIMGALGGGLMQYARRTGIMMTLQSKGMSVTRAANYAQRHLKKHHPLSFMGRLGHGLSQSRNAVLRSIGKSPLATAMGLGAAVGLLPVLPFLPGALAPEKTSDELLEIYSGRQEIPVRRSRWWMMGRSPMEGSGVSYYRQHLIAETINRSKERGLWSNLEEEYGRELSPLEKSYIKNFTYKFEESNYRDRPYPISGKAFSDVPIIGPILSATIGKLVKPERLYHVEEWLQNGQYRELPSAFGGVRATNLGEEDPLAPVSPHGITSTVRQQVYNLAELSGLPGFLATAMKEELTGSQDLFDQDRILQSADRAYGYERKYWDMELGDPVGASELYRRLFPHRIKSIEEYNPIANNMPSWVSGADERGPNLKSGDPYLAVPFGESRLPGKGYETRFPELEGIDPEHYPLIHKYKISQDVFPYSESADAIEGQISSFRKSKDWGEYEEDIFQEVKRQRQERRNRKNFHEYKYRDKKLTPIGEVLAEHNESLKDPATKPSWFDRTMGSYWETLTHSAETPLEYLTPISPANKLLHMRTAVEDYEKTQVTGTESSFWNRPFENFIRPMAYEAARTAGYEGVPAHIEKKRNLEEFFDILKYTKYTRFKNMATEAGDVESANEFEMRSRETRVGLSPYSFNYTQIYRSLPRRDRDYFSSFSTTTDTEDRARILQLVPENEKGLYVAKWKQQDAADYRTALKKGLLDEEQIQEGETKLQELFEEKSSDGFPKTKQLFSEYVATRLQNETYSDWYRRTKVIPQRVDELGYNMPGPNWVGFRPEVQLDDIKLKLVQNLSETIQDYDLWPSAERALKGKQQFVNDDAIEPLLESETSEEDVRRQVQDVLTDFGISKSQIFVSMEDRAKGRIDLDVKSDRRREIQQMKQRGTIS